MQVSQFLPGPVKGVISTSTVPDVIHPHITLTENSVPQQVSLRVCITELEEGESWCNSKFLVYEEDYYVTVMLISDKPSKIRVK